MGRGRRHALARGRRDLAACVTVPVAHVVSRHIIGRVQSATSAWKHVGSVSQTWHRPDPHAPPLRANALDVVAGIGIRDDCHSDSLSPRQALFAFAGAYRRLGLPDGALRENLTVTADVKGWASGSLVLVGRGALFSITFACEPCARLNNHRRGLLREIGADRGMLARALADGRVKPGDAVYLLPGVQIEWPAAWQDRICFLAGMVPPGFVVEYRQLARLAGVPAAFCRVFPRILAAAPDVPSDRVVASDASITVPRWTGSEVFSDRYVSRLGAGSL